MKAKELFENVRHMRIMVNTGKKLTERHADWIITQISQSGSALSKTNDLNRKFISYNLFFIPGTGVKQGLKILRRLSRGEPKFTIVKYASNQIIDIQISELEEQ